MDFLRRAATEQAALGMILAAYPSNSTLADEVVAKDYLRFVKSVITGMPEQTQRVFRLCRQEHNSYGFVIKFKETLALLNNLMIFTICDDTRKAENLEMPVFAFGRHNQWHEQFCLANGVNSMYSANYGLGIPSSLSAENQLRAVFRIINSDNGNFIFNIWSVDIDKAIVGFDSFEDASSNNMITEWELSILMQNEDYLAKTIFHNGKSVLPQTDGGIEIRWN